MSNLSNIDLKADNNIYEKGIWDLLDKNKNQYYFTKEILNYKEEATFLSILDMLRFNSIFCIEYNLNEGCSNCGFQLSSKNYLKPYINIDESDLLNKNSIEKVIYKSLSNKLYQCSICGYQNGKIINENNPNFYQIINDKYFLILFL